MSTQRPVGAIVLAAGLGTRMKSAQAKVLHRLGGKSLIAYPLATLRSIGVDPIVVVVGYQADAVRDAAAPYGARFALQPDQKGTGDATRVAQAALHDFHGDLVLVYGDLPLLRPETFRNLITKHQAAHAAVSLLTEAIDDPSGFGRIVRDDHGDIARIVEDRDATAVERKIREVNVGVYCVDADFLFRALAELQPTNAQSELYLTDIIASARSQGMRVADAQATPGEAAQISSRLDLAAREKTLRDTINNQWMAAGVTFEDPATAYIGPDVTIGRDTVIGPNVTLRGKTCVGEACRFDGTALISDTAIGNRTHIKFGVVSAGAVIADDVQVGPFAQLRPGTNLGSKVHIGDFVETKNTVVHAGAKAMHHAYLGDAEIGADTNIGCGTITCNYDGFHKTRTIIGARVQVGSDSTLVAPITIGDDAYVATATTVRKDVAPGALVFNPREQAQRPGWVAARRAREGRAPVPVAAPGPTKKRALASSKKATTRPKKRTARR